MLYKWADMFPRTAVPQKNGKKSIDMFPHTPPIKNGPQTSIQAARATLSA